MSRNDYMKDFINRLPEVEGSGYHQALYSKGTAYDVFSALGSVGYFPTVDDVSLRGFELPCYGGCFGMPDYIGWEVPGAPSLTVGDWLDWYAGENDPQLPTINHFLADESELEALPPSLAIKDTTLDAIVLVDGCHRALARAVTGLSIPLLLYTSPFAHLLIFPTHFINHAIKQIRERMPV